MSSRSTKPRNLKRKDLTKIDLKKWPDKALGEEPRTLPVALTPQAMMKISKEAGDTSIEISDLRKALSDEGAEKRAQIKKLQTKLDGLLRSQSTGMEDREIKVAFVPDYQGKRVYTVRKDSGDVLESRPTTASELETKFGFDEPNLTGKARKISKNRGAEEKGAEAGDGRTEPSSDDAPAE